MSYTDVYVREQYATDRETLLRRLLVERYGWARRDLRLSSDNEGLEAA